MVSVEVVSEIGAISVTWGASGDESDVTISVVFNEVEVVGLRVVVVIQAF